MLFVTIFFFTCLLVMAYCQVKSSNSIRRLKQEVRILEGANESLSENQVLLTLAEGIAHLGSWEISVGQKDIKWSDELYNIYGYESNNFRPDARITEEVIAPEYREKVRRELNAAISNRTTFAIEYQIIQPSGERRYVLNQGIYLEKDNKLVGAVQDITELKEAILKLRINESLLREAEMVSHSGSWEWLEGKEYMLWSDEMYNIHGYLPHSVFIDLFFYKDLVHKDDRLIFIRNFNRARKGRQPFKINYRVVRPTGEIRHVLSTAEYKRIGLNDKYAFIGNTQDVTELREAQVKLEEKVAELNRSNQDLEQFAYVASHDLQEPLRKIQRFGERLKDKLSGRLDTEAVDYLDRMNNAAERMRTLINDLLAFSKATRDHKKFVKVRLAEVICQAIRELDLMVESKKAVIKLYGDAEIEGIESQLIQLFQNLIGNSLKFTRAGIYPDIEINIELKHGQEHCIVSVRDNGIGFEEGVSLQIFDIFYRLHSRSEYEGTGIGLAICRKIADNHAGAIYGSGEKDKGAVFTVELPARQIK